MSYILNPSGYALIYEYLSSYLILIIINKLFITNYSYQHYLSLAMSWPPEDGYSHHARDFYDFRSSNWFVEAATSPKDLVILLDDSDDLSSSYWRLAKATVSGLLDTLGPNDFVNVYRYSDTVSEIHSCYTKILAQVCLVTMKRTEKNLPTIHQTIVARFFVNY